MTWAYSPSYGKPLSVPQGIIGLLTRFGMDVTLAHPEGYDLHPRGDRDRAQEQQRQRRQFYASPRSMEEAFQDADIVYPKSWAPYRVMEQRTELLQTKRPGWPQGAGEGVPGQQCPVSKTGNATRRR